MKTYFYWHLLPVCSPQLLIDGILGTLVIFLVLELLICITAMLFGLSVLAARGNQVSKSSTCQPGLQPVA